MTGADRRPRLAYLTSEYPAPSHTFIRREIAALRDQGWAIDTFSIRATAPADANTANSEEAARTFVVLKQPIWRIGAAHLRWMVTHPLRYVRAIGLAAGHRAPGLHGLFLAGAHFVEAGVLARELDSRGVDHLHNHFANSGATVGMLAARLAQIGWSFTMHGVSETDYPAGLLLGRKIEAADFVACASWFMRAQAFRSVAPEHWDKVHVVRCGVALGDLPAREERQSAVPTLISVGRLSPEKGQAGLLEGVATVLKSHQAELCLVGDGPTRPLLEKLADELGISSRVHFRGTMSEAATLVEIANADLLVLPSFLEGLPLVLIEAMAVGVPVIAARVAGIPELVDDGRNGVLFTPSNWSELADRISQLLSDPALRSRMIARARRTVASEFDIRLAAKSLSDLFASVGEDRGRAGHAHSRAATFGLREAIVFSLIAISIAASVAVRSEMSSSGPEPLARRSMTSER